MCAVGVKKRKEKISCRERDLDLPKGLRREGLEAADIKLNLLHFPQIF